MTIEFPPVRLTIDDEARLVYVDDGLRGVVTLHDEQTMRAPVHMEAYFCGDAPDTFDSLEPLEIWIRETRNTLG